MRRWTEGKRQAGRQSDRWHFIENDGARCSAELISSAPSHCAVESARKQNNQSDTEKGFEARGFVNATTCYMVRSIATSFKRNAKGGIVVDERPIVGPNNRVHIICWHFAQNGWPLCQYMTWTLDISTHTSRIVWRSSTTIHSVTIFPISELRQTQKIAILISMISFRSFGLFVSLHLLFSLVFVPVCVWCKWPGFN